MIQKQPFGRARVATATTAPSRERRRKRRRPDIEAGKLSSKHNAKGVDCTISDISESGACVLVKVDVSGIPNDVVLVRLRSRASHPAAVVWRKGQRIGLKFTPTSTSFLDRFLGR